MAYSDNLIPTMTSATTPSGVVTASGSFGSYAAWQAFNKSSTAWLVQTTTAWLQYQFPSTRAVTQYAITPGYVHTGGFPVKSWAFKGSDNGTDWTTLDAQTDVTNWGAGHMDRKVFPFTNATAYAYYRLDITASNDPSFSDMGELEMMEGDAPPPPPVTYVSRSIGSGIGSGIASGIG